jgi:uncharacterized membrane protein YkvA (DUF1232 family)
MVGEKREPRVGSFHEMLQERVDSWLATEESKTIACAELYRHLPGLFLFLTRVALDARLPEPERRGVLAALKYVVAPFDLIPEGVVGTSGFRDDLVLAALVVDRLYARVDRAVLDEHWQAEGEPQTIARAVLEAGEAMVGSEIWERLREWLPR